jgi:hypothetical protein
LSTGPRCKKQNIGARYNLRFLEKVRGESEEREEGRGEREERRGKREEKGMRIEEGRKKGGRTKGRAYHKSE